MSDEAAQLLAEAEEQIEAWLCELDEQWHGLLAGAHAEADRLVAEAREHAAALVDEAERDARTVLAGAAKLAGMQLAEAEAEAAKARALAEESRQAASALAVAADAAVTGKVGRDDLVALASAVQRLRTELGRVVDAAFDALPAVEATAAALQLAPAPPPRRRGLVRRLLRAA